MTMVRIDPDKIQKLIDHSEELCGTPLLAAIHLFAAAASMATSREEYIYTAGETFDQLMLACEREAGHA